MAATSIGGRTAIGRRRALPFAIAGVVILLVLFGAMYLYDHSRRDTIASGVKIAGVPVGGLSAAAARNKLNTQLVAQVSRPVVVRLGSRHWTLEPRSAAVRVDVAAMVDQAIAASREGSIFSRTVRNLFGSGLHRDIPLDVAYSHAAVKALVARVAADTNRAPRDATVQPSPSGLHTIPSQDGIAVYQKRLAASISGALVGTAPSRVVHPALLRRKPAITTANLAAKYPAYIVVDRASFQLKFYSHLKLTKQYLIAVGMEGLETSPGLYHIQWEQVNPPWYVPKKAWAGALAGTVVPPGPADPLKARFMAFNGGAGIHGIDPSEYSSLGHDASHGCVRMRIPDVIALYSVSPVGTPVYVL
jgi:L,D-transpeptidase-like protein/putative peptidoglycan binding protein